MWAHCVSAHGGQVATALLEIAECRELKAMEAQLLRAAERFSGSMFVKASLHAGVHPHCYTHGRMFDAPHTHPLPTAGP